MSRQAPGRIHARCFGGSYDSSGALPVGMLGKDIHPELPQVNEVFGNHLFLMLEDSLPSVVVLRPSR